MDIGFEKFWNIKCRTSNLVPDAAVIVATVRALKSHGGGPAVKPGSKLDEAYTKENVALVEAGCANLRAHIETVVKSGVTPVVCLNAFYTDTVAEQAVVRRVAEETGALFAVSKHWEKGGEGAIELAEAVVEASSVPPNFKFLYSLDEPIEQKIEKIAKEVYGADGVEYSDVAAAKLKVIESDPATSSDCRICIGGKPRFAFARTLN